ncbi:DUF5685 family protein [Nocardia sp. CA-107356]|uniref:DUF5685 family protein n=1 Tax=Nocardia sp. CA-107356 TaxID=3239972 RepID=UPI003D8B9706
MLRPCAHAAEKYGIDAAEWRTHMCGLCLGLRDGHGQLARAATNTDAIVLSVLTEAQMSGPMARTTAGPCALRGMRRAEVAAANSPGVLLASTASLLLGSARIRDHVDDGDSSALTRRPMTKVSSRWADRARSQASLIGLDVEPLVAAINSQANLEALALSGAGRSGRDGSAAARSLGFGPIESAATPSRGLSGGESTVRALIGAVGGRVPNAEESSWENLTSAVSLDDLTAPTQICAAELFAHTAVLADRPENIAALREAGRHFGRIAHLADAVEDFDEDRTRGRFNPLAATETSMPEAYDILRQSDSQLRAAVAEAGLDQVPVIRWMLLDPLRGLVRRIGRGVGATAHACNLSRDTATLQQPLPLGTAMPQQPLSLVTVTPQHPLPLSTATMQHPLPPDVDFRKPPRRPGIGAALAIVFGVYCTGYACCADHTNPCNGHRKEAWIKKCDCGDCCDCCDCSCDGCDCCSDCGCCDCGCDC